MFDLRYHVASLAAVFLALIIGILVGVGIASQTSVEESERRVLEERISNLQRDLEEETGEIDLLRRQQEAGTTYTDASYPVVMNGRLRTVRVALLFIGPVEPGLQDAVTRTLADASGPALARRRALELPVDPQAVMNAIPPEADDLTFEEIGRRLGRELVAGGETPLWDALEEVIVEEGQGASELEIDAIVVAHTARLDHAPTARLVSGLYAGIASSGVPAVGVERAEARPTRIGVYVAAGLSSVDSVDTPLGRVALAVLLAGGQEGQYGLKSTANAAVPPIEVLPLAPLPGG
ncbi:MAG TPA: copper transporter [Gaiellaceae bacterium]|nr:copper transporter [Gaiellaceae bacterium]